MKDESGEISKEILVCRAREFELYSEINENNEEFYSKGVTSDFCFRKISSCKILVKELKWGRLEQGDKEETIDFSFFSHCIREYAKEWVIQVPCICDAF